MPWPKLVEKLFFLLALYSSIHVIFYMSSGDARCSQLLFASMLLRNWGKHQHKNQLKDYEKTQKI